MKTTTSLRMAVVRVLVAVLGVGLAPQAASAASGAWTATGSGQVAYWTNNANWSGASYPGSGGSESAYLTNSTANTYTCILDSSLPNSISTLAVSNKGGGAAWLIVTNAVLTSTTFSMNTGGRLQIDNGGSVTGITSFTWNGVNGLMNINSGRLYKTSGDLTIGDTAGSGGNRLTVNGGTVRAAAYIRVGHFGNGNTMTASNATVNCVGLDIGWLTQPDNSSSNTVIIGTGTIWNAGGGNVNVGAEGYQYRYGPNSRATNNVLIVDGGVLTNAASLSVYQYYSRLTVTNGGKVFNNGQLWQGTTGNVVTVTGPGSYLKIGGSFALSGYNSDGRASNALLIANGGVVDGTTPIFQGGQVTITGAGSAYSNAGSFSVGGNYASILADAGGKITFSALTVSGASNTMTFSGSGSGLLRTPASASLTLGGFSNSLTFSNGAALDIGFGSGFSVGNASGANYNSLNIGGSGASCTFTGQYNDVIGGSGGMGNSMTVTNATVYRGGNYWGMTIGNASPSNTILIAAGGIWDGGTKDKIIVGNGAATGNVLRVNTCGVITNLQTAGIVVGNSATASGNRAIVDGGSILLAGATMSIANGTDNQAILQNGGLVEAGTLSVAAGAGNMMTNSGGVYQFTTATPTITTNGYPDGAIFINGGTISYRGVNPVALTANWSSDLKKMTWLGDNALRLNGSTASSPAGGYTFNTGISPTNYCRLEMINGTTAITGSGNPITIGANGSLLVDNTTATIAGVVTNLGTLQVLSGKLICSTNLVLGAGATTVVGVRETTNAVVQINGTFTPGGTLTISNMTGFVMAGGQSWDLFNWTGGTISFAATNLPALTGGATWDTSQLGSNGIISVVSGSSGPVTNVWTGGTSTNWGTAGNWAEGHVPTASEIVRIRNNSPTYWPVLDMTRSVSALLLESGARLSLGGNSLTISSNMVMTGTLVANGTETVTLTADANWTSGTFSNASSTVLIGGTGAQALSFGGIVFNNLVVQNTNALTLNGSFSAATFTNAGGNLTFGAGVTASNFVCRQPGVTLTFKDGASYAITNLTLAGGTTNPITLLSSTPTAKWKLSVAAASYVSRVTVSDSDASFGLKIRPAASSEGTPGSTINWDFGSGAWSVWVGGSTSFTNAVNWSPSGSPGTTSRLFIGATNGIAAPVLTNAITVGELAIGNGPASLTLQAPLVVTGRVTILPDGVLTHPSHIDTPLYRVDLSVGGDLEISAGGAINVDGKGYASGNTGYGGYGPAPGTYGGTNWYAASHGGMGGHETGHAGSPYPTYGSVTNPTTLGSGGSGTSASESPGGGVAIVRVNGATTIAAGGRISANVPDSPGFWRGGGAGGSVNLITATLAGEGVVQAHGGKGTVIGGGGGRVAVRLTGADTFGGIAITAYGGLDDDIVSGSRKGAAGTVYRQTASQGEGNGALAIDNTGYYTWSDVTTLMSTNVTDATVGDVVIRNSARFALASNTAISVGGAWSNAATLTAATGSVVHLRAPNPGIVYGTNVFQILAITNAGASKTVYFEAGKTNWVNGSLLARNATLLSTVDGSWWHLRLASNATQNVKAVTVKDSNATNGQTIVAQHISVDLLHNVNWVFENAPGTVFTFR